MEAEVREKVVEDSLFPTLIDDWLKVNDSHLSNWHNLRTHLVEFAKQLLIPSVKIKIVSGMNDQTKEGCSPSILYESFKVELSTI